MVVLLLRNWIRVRWRSQGRSRPVLFVGLLSRLVLFAGATGIVYLMVIATSRTEPQAVAGLLPALLPGAGFLMILAGTTRALQRLYLDDELEMLLVAPLKQSTLFAFNLFRMALGTMALIGLLQLAALSGYGSATRAPVAFFFAAMVITVLMAVMSSAISLPFMMLIIRLVPARRLRTVLAALGPLQGLVFFAVAGAGRPGAGRRVALAGEGIQRNRGLARLPTTWAANALDGIRLGDSWAFATNATLLVGTTAVCMVLAWVIYQRSFAEGLDRLRDVSSTRPSRAPGWPIGPSWLPQSVRPIAVNDWRRLRRDPGSLVGLMIPMAMIVFLVMSSGGRSPGGGFHVPYLMFSATSPAMSAFSGDTAAFALLREAPLSAARLLASKYVSNLLPALIIVMLGVTAIGLLTHMEMGSFTWLLLASAAVACILVAVHIALAARQLTSTRGGARVAAGGILMVIALDLAIAAPTGVLIGAVADSGWIPSSVRTPTGAVLLLMLEVLSMSGLALLLTNAAKRIERWEPTG